MKVYALVFFLTYHVGIFSMEPLPASDSSSDESPIEAALSPKKIRRLSVEDQKALFAKAFPSALNNDLNDPNNRVFFKLVYGCSPKHEKVNWESLALVERNNYIEKKLQLRGISCVGIYESKEADQPLSEEMRHKKLCAILCAHGISQDRL